MNKPIMKQEFFLSLPSKEASIEDVFIGTDLLDTLGAHTHECVGMAANMIGIAKRIIVFDNDGSPMLMFNPEIIEKSDPYEAQEACLSLEGLRTTQRFETIRVRYMDESFEEHTENFEGRTAQIIQHEIDHCNGVLI